MPYMRNCKNIKKFKERGMKRKILVCGSEGLSNVPIGKRG